MPSNQEASYCADCGLRAQLGITSRFAQYVLCRVLDYAEHPALCVGSLKESNSLARVTRHNHRVARNTISLSVGL